jgi:hypothetical protein
MIIKAPKNSQTGLYDIKANGENLEFNHIQEITPVLERAADIRKDSNNGWTEKKGFRHIACVPTCEFVKHPELAYDQKALTRWLKTEYGSMFRTVDGGLG